MHLNNEATKLYRELVARYKRVHVIETVEVHDVVRWAIARGDLELPPAALVLLHAERMSEALRTETAQDEYGRKVRLHHCVETQTKSAEGRLLQRFLWAHIDDAADEHLMTSLQQRRGKVAADVQSLRADLDFINSRRRANHKPPIQMSFDFTDEAGSGTLSA